MERIKTLAGRGGMLVAYLPAPAGAGPRGGPATTLIGSGFGRG